MEMLQWKTKKSKAIENSINRHDKKLTKQKFGVSARKFTGIVTAKIIGIHESAVNDSSYTISIAPIRKTKKCKRNILFCEKVTYSMIIKKKLIWYAIATKKIFKIRFVDRLIKKIEVVN